jgi:two-component system OmpR family response regulator
MSAVGDRRRGSAPRVQAARVLVVAGDPAARAITSRALRESGFAVSEACSGAAALEATQDDRFDLVVLDTALRDTSGINALRKLREHGDVPVIVVGARDSDVERVLFLELGADDCLTTPFSPAELVSRGRAVLRRRRREGSAPSSVSTVGALCIDVARREVSLDGRRIELTWSEFEILALLSSRPGHVFARRAIMEHLCPGTYFGDGHAADMHILNLRRKLELDPRRPALILTVRAAGFKLAAPWNGSSPNAERS